MAIQSIITRLTDLYDKDSSIDFQRQSISQSLVKLKEAHAASQQTLNDWELEFPKYDERFIGGVRHLCLAKR